MAKPISDAQIRSIFAGYRRIAVVGLSPKPWRASFNVTQYMIDAGYEVSGVRPGTSEILGRPCYDRLKDIPGPIEIVNVFRASEAIPEVVEEVITAGAKMLWLQEGITHPEAEARAEAAGIQVISDRCILKEHDRLLSIRTRGSATL